MNNPYSISSILQRLDSRRRSQRRHSLHLFWLTLFWSALLSQSRAEPLGAFTEVTLPAGLNTTGFPFGNPIWGDFDNDGDLDLSITKGARKGKNLGIKKDELYENRGNTLTNIAESAGVTNTWGRGRSVAWGDYNNDGSIDLLLGNLKTALVLYKNSANGTFRDVTASAGLAGLRHIECAFADYNGDGFQDIFCTAAIAFKPPQDELFKNNGDGTL